MKGTTLSQGDYLTVGDFLFVASPTQPYGFCLMLTSDGDLRFFYGEPANPRQLQYGSVLQDYSRSIYKQPGFQPGQGGPASYFAIMQSDGNFCVYRGTGPADNHGHCWSTNTYGKGSQPYAAMLHTDGNFHVGGSYQSGTMTVLWTTTMRYPSMRVGTGSRLTSGQWMAPGDQITATGTSAFSEYTFGAWMTDGDLQLVHWPASGNVGVGGKNIKQYWSAVANGHGIVYGSKLGGHMYAVMQGDGNLCIYNGTDPGHPGPAYWGILSQSRQQGNYVLQLNGDGTLTAGSQDTQSAPYWTAPGTRLAVQIVAGAGQTVHVSRGYDVVQFPQPMTVRIVYPNQIPVAGASVTFGQSASTMGEVTIYYAPRPMLENIFTTITTDSNGFASTPMWGSSVLGGPNQPGAVEQNITVAGFGGYPGDGLAIDQYVFMDGQ
jgi:hypothetical protein